ncbi:MAG TPA: adenylate/guanylate cyclase domain-containing protein [Stellaceae bacterium]|nr:adenylate/guanylate cyclase domain-containing protein [Stellaceae bacterium]
MERRLAAVLFADVAGYTRLMDEYEADTHARLMVLLEEVIEPTIAAAHGQIVKNTGDGFLARFESVSNAFDCAIAVQRSINARESDRPLDKRVAFRMGLHVGDIVVEAHDVYGAGVNLAARLQEFAEPGELAISALVREQLGNNLKLTTLDLGNVTLKNIAAPVRIYRVASLSQAERQRTPAAGAPWKSRPSIAVLSFVEYGVKPGDSFIGEGISEDVVAALASLPDLFVISRSSTLKYRDAPVNIETVGRELGVRYVLSGSVRRRDDRLRVLAELADTESLEVIVTDRIEGPASDLFELQDRLTERVLQTIAPHIRGAEVRRARSKRTDNLDAYDYFLRGLDLLYRLDSAQFEQARRMFELSISLDENYAAPHAFTALWHSIRFQQGWSPDKPKDLKSVDEFAAAALQRDANDVWALSLSGHLRAFLFRDFDVAFALFDRALRASPNSAFAWARSSPAFNYIGEPAEARRRAEEALRLSPFDPHILFTHCTLGIAAYIEGDYETAIAWGRRSYAGNPIYTANLRFLTASLAANGQLEEARRVGATLRSVEPHFQVRRFLETYALQDQKFKARLEEHLVLAGLPE